MENLVLVKSFSKRHKNLEKKILLNAKKVLKYLKENNLVFEVFVVSEKKMEALNAKFRGKRESTNVLSFEIKDWPEVKLKDEKIRFVGEIYLSPEYIQKKRESFEKMLVHGILHLLGYDHRQKGDTIKMENLEKKIAKKLGF